MMMNSSAATIADKYIARDGGSPSRGAKTPRAKYLSDAELGWLRKAVLRSGYMPTQERDGAAAPHLSDLRLLFRRGFVQGMPWRITKAGRDAVKDHEAPTISTISPAKIVRADVSVLNPITFAQCTLAAVEREHILATLRHCLGNRTRAAEILDISLRTIRNKLRSYRAQGIAIPAANVSSGPSNLTNESMLNTAIKVGFP